MVLNHCTTDNGRTLSYRTHRMRQLIPNRELYIGLMSGTSADAIDAALVDFTDPQSPALVNLHTQPMPSDIRSALLTLADANSHVSLADLGAIDQRIGYWFGHAANALMQSASVNADDICAIGSHGQTLFHAPEKELGFSTQIGSPSRIAAETGCTVVADFRNADIAVGGQGAPLVPAFHAAVFGHPERTRAVLNIGGIANLSIIPPCQHGQTPHVLGFDTGPGNALMDAWIEHHRGLRYDSGGRWASAGVIDTDLLMELLADSYIRRAPPKSTGRDHYGLAWLRSRIDRCPIKLHPADVQATLCRFTAVSAGDALCAHSPQRSDVIICGGGAYNTYLRAMIADIVAPRPVSISNDLGFHVNAVEAMAFAWLARQRLNGKPGNIPSVTGAQIAVCLGGVFLPPRMRP